MSEHKAVLLEEAVNGLAIRAGGIYVDATFGRGGHSREILRRLDATGKLIALDRDAEAVASAGAIEDDRFVVRHARFGELRRLLDGLKVKQVDGVLLDLGISSPQIDVAERGFSFRADAPLDMRMDRTQGETAAQWLARADEAELKGVIRDYGEERFAGAIAKAIIAARVSAPIATTAQLARIVGAAVRTREPGQDPATRTFQALRIHLNQELEELSLALPQTVEALKPGGRLAVISFHSLEDRKVKNFMRDLAQPQVPERLPLTAAQMPRPTLTLIGKAQKPSDREVAENPRARSAILRVAEKAST
ncbi:MAG TPA: 16S rRNA (cytosine(1402)-N(4))-methyltransferase RsmH [Burkholderiales bacterium]|nr:16S rRNA (cytosine(1402)-N(4))-methyltransferase RsmH [Burkholderiales bacterium]